MRQLKVLQTHEMADKRILVWVETPEDMEGFSQAQAKAELFEKIVRLDIDGEEKNYLVRGFEMMGYEDRIVEKTLGLMVRKKEPPISQCKWMTLEQVQKEKEQESRVISKMTNGLLY